MTTAKAKPTRATDQPRIQEWERYHIMIQIKVPNLLLLLPEQNPSFDCTTPKARRRQHSYIYIYTALSPPFSRFACRRSRCSHSHCTSTGLASWRTRRRACNKLVPSALRVRADIHFHFDALALALAAAAAAFFLFLFLFSSGTTCALTGRCSSAATSRALRPSGVRVPGRIAVQVLCGNGRRRWVWVAVRVLSWHAHVRRHRHARTRAVRVQHGRG